MTRLPLHRTDDGSILDDEGKILFYSADRFRRDIVDHCCFICGAPPGSVVFNDEHVIPDWILRRFRLHAKRIVVPGGTALAYGQYRSKTNEMGGSDRPKVPPSPRHSPDPAAARTN